MYYGRVITDPSASVQTGSARLLYNQIQNLDLIPYTKFLWYGQAGTVVSQSRVSKIYSINTGSVVDGTSSGIYRPYYAGTIAPIQKNNLLVDYSSSQYYYISHSNISFGTTSP